ncbi:unnamed protein product [Ceutorhynchus assimilis]|uniref:Glutaredoxin domain-containing protein n=1 Tax=Ceutorhynchus assimilis TaxID=467358 RepID=A0A9P0GQE1_9CUCU|nr:unnamed protein product [Ceutorhynchus assimilis]
MSEQQPVTCLPPPLPPKTKPRRAAIDEDRRYADNQDGIIISASYSSPSSRSSAITTVNLNTVDLNIPDGFQELTYSCKNSGKSHVVKILINPEEYPLDRNDPGCNNSDSVVSSDVVPSGETCIRISVNNNHNTMVDAVGSPQHYYFNQFNNLMSSGQMSPSDTLDSGTCSDLDGTPPPLTKKKNGSGVSVTLIGSHKKTASLSDSDDNESNISCDSLNCGKVSPIAGKPTIIGARSKSLILPQNLLKDIRQRKDIESYSLVDEKSYEDRQNETTTIEEVNSDMFFDFHLNENNIKEEDLTPVMVNEDETFAGYKDFLVADKPATIKSAKGTVRGVRNRVRAGIATFLQINSAEKSYKEKDGGKVVVYTTTMGIIRDTYQACTKVKQILRTLLVKFEERDVFMSVDYQNEIRERMKCEQILVPQVFVDGQHCGDAETLERLNESGELRKILKAYKNPDVCSTCQMCGGYRLLPCTVCNGSKKSVHRNHFTAEFVALKCMNCDENGLVRCTICS